jgi:hypothetical protein
LTNRHDHRLLLLLLLLLLLAHTHFRVCSACEPHRWRMTTVTGRLGSIRRGYATSCLNISSSLPLALRIAVDPLGSR